MRMDQAQGRSRVPPCDIPSRRTSWRVLRPKVHTGYSKTSICNKGFTCGLTALKKIVECNKIEKNNRQAPDGRGTESGASHPCLTASVGPRGEVGATRKVPKIDGHLDHQVGCAPESTVRRKLRKIYCLAEESLL